MSRAHPARAVLAPVLVGLVLGALGGWLWWTWWGPPPLGKVYDTPAGPTWYPTPFDPGVTRDFSGTATSVVVGLGLALLLGAIGGWLSRGRAVVGLAAVVVASLAAAAVMALIGVAKSPEDPQSRVDEVKIGAELPGDLEVSGWTPYLIWPVGALLGHMVVMLSLPTTSGGVIGAGRRPEHRSDVPAPQG